MLINLSRNVVVLLAYACFSYSKWVRLGGFKSVENDLMKMSHHGLFEIFSIIIKAQPSTFFLTNFPYYTCIDMHVVHKGKDVFP